MAFSFGQPAASAAPAGASTSAPTFSFGATQPAQQQPQQQQPAQQPASGGLFSFGKPAGSTAGAAPATSAPTLSFGAPVASAPGQQPAGSAPAPSGGLFSFGNPAPATSSAPSLFGSTAATGQTSQPGQQPGQQPASTGLFGSTTNAAGASGTSGGLGSLFGSKPAGATGTTGALGTGSLFGQTQTQAQGHQAGQQQQQGTGALGASTSGAPASTAPPLDPRKMGQPLNAQLETLYKAWDSSNVATCRFRHYFYNNVGEQAISSLAGNPYAGRRADAIGRDHDALWSAATAQNPDPKRLLPVLAVGFGDLKKRHAAQQAEATRQLQHLTLCSERLKVLERKHSLGNSVRQSAAASKQVELHHRLLALIRKAHLMIPSLRGMSIEPEEEKLRAQLEALEAEIEGTAAAGGAGAPLLSRASGAARLRASINELWAQIGALRAKRDAMMRASSNGGAGPGAIEWAVVDQSSLNQVVKILDQQQKGLNHLSDTLTSDTHALDVIFQGLQGVKLVGVKGPLGSRPRESL